MNRKEALMADPTKGRFRGQEFDLADLRMMLTKDELAEVEVTLEDGSIIRPFRFCEPNPEIRRDKDGKLSF
jgi:hypothetical protein